MTFPPTLANRIAAIITTLDEELMGTASACELGVAIARELEPVRAWHRFGEKRPEDQQPVMVYLGGQWMFAELTAIGNECVPTWVLDSSRGWSKCQPTDIWMPMPPVPVTEETKP